MPKKETKRKRPPKNLKPNLLIVFSFIIILLLGLALLSHTLAVKQSFEAPSQEVATIPKDVQKSYQPPLASNSATLRVPILLYHYVEYVKDKKDTVRQSLDIPPNIFDAQVKTLREAGFTFMTAGELADVLDGKMKLPEKPVILTFDDGHWDLDTDVLPILKKYDAKATAYIVPGFIGGSDSLSSTQLEDVIRSGLVEIGDHTVHHTALAGRDLHTVQDEVFLSEVMLNIPYHLHVVSFAYPYGSFDKQAISVVRSAGFKTAVSTVPGVLQNQSNRFFLFRIRPGYRIGQELVKFLEQSTYRAY